ncbi:MAG: aspartate/glutamate racemase family protein [Bacteroidetes bacterium]|nr:aspartate/glutamate racemase family protein [Bacteroidota bacterium]
MKTIGLIGGLTWHSSLDYYRYFNQLTNERLGGAEASRVILNSVNFGDIKRFTLSDDWDSITQLIGTVAQETERAGASCILLGANTMHYIAERVQAMINVPLLHIADATAVAIKEKQLDTVLLLGTKYTMQFDFYRNKLAAHGIKALIPDADGVEMINESIYNELDKGLFLPATREKYLTLIEASRASGVQGVILGCTEIPLLIKQEHCPIPVFDTAFLHAKAAVDFATASYEP